MNTLLTFLLIPYLVLGLGTGAMIFDRDVPVELQVVVADIVALLVWLPFAVWARRLGAQNQLATGDGNQEVRGAWAKELVRPFAFAAAGAFVVGALIYPMVF